MSSYLLSMSPVDEIGGYVDDGSDDMTAGYLSFDIDEYYLPEADHALYAGQQAAADPPVAHSLQADDADSYKSGGKAASSEGLSYHDKINNHQSLTSAGKSCKIAFKTRSEVEVMDDGYRWRKYGKKMVKNSPNPRNYYRCSSEGCRVKKRVERERDDARFVITTYHGVHDHPAPLPPRGCAGYSLAQPHYQ